jgi:hypothetical protein
VGTPAVNWARLALLGGLVGGALGWARVDYRRWIAVGPGGLPHTARGWFTMSALRLRAATVDPRDTRGLTGVGHLRHELPRRVGPRPRVAPYPIPHRQLDQRPEPPLNPPLTATRLASRDPRLIVRLSHFEKHTEAAYAPPGIVTHEDGHVSAGEIGHVHPTDGSLHLVLAPADAAAVIDAGWGELHPLAGRAAGLPGAYTLIYSPRDGHEAEIVERIFDAAAGHMLGRPENIS